MKVYLGRDGVIERMQKDLLGFSNANLSELTQVTEFYVELYWREMESLKE